MFYLILFLLGLAIGSFVNVVIYRLPKGRTFIKGRSQCPSCGREIAWFDLIPVISFFVLGFKCRRCKAKISWVYPAIEIYSGLLFVLSFWIFGSSGFINWLFYVFLLETLLILAVIDLKYLILPDSLILTALIAALAYGLFQRAFLEKGPALIFSANNLITAAAAFSLFFLIWFFSRGRWLGLGDAKLAGVIGLIFGQIGTAVILYGAVVAGAIVGLALLATKKAGLKTKLPFGSFVGLAASFYIFLSPVIIEKVANTFRFIIPVFN